MSYWGTRKEFKADESLRQERTQGRAEVELRCGAKRGPAGGWSVWRLYLRGVEKPIVQRSKEPVREAAEWFLSRGADPEMEFKVVWTQAGMADVVQVMRLGDAG